MTLLQTFKNNEGVTATKITLGSGERVSVTFDKPVFLKKGRKYGVLVQPWPGVIFVDLVAFIGPRKRTRRALRRWRHKMIPRTLAQGRHVTE
jgi:hypothetical protein